jgi:hypothetical protein
MTLLKMVRKTLFWGGRWLHDRNRDRCYGAVEQGRGIALICLFSKDSKKREIWRGDQLLIQEEKKIYL